MNLAKAPAHQQMPINASPSLPRCEVGGNGIELSIGADELVPQTIRAAYCQAQDRAVEEEAIALWFQLSSHTSKPS
ncbi:MAG: hypothetical protein NTY67_10630 [Cyanobacteria bacterium]|nr:hypothetical protein [Cyanobacteriota bacterium]